MSTKSCSVLSIGLLCLSLLSVPGSAQPTADPLGPKGLNWVLPFVGDWNCYQQGENGNGGGGSGAGANLTYSIKMTKNNVTLDSIQPSPLLTAHSVITYDAESEMFNYTYSDSGGNSGPGTSVGWEEGGHFRFITWPLTNPGRPGIQARTMDDFLRPTGPDQFTDKFYASQDGGNTWLPAGQLDCTRAAKSPAKET
ncbi:uncharacterized protein Triagg1_8945 [Trichoderma aggressivum f. europaeum]|uniref:DUF1579 domain-containing protein n=1 Tax=Trichoderma aggressivum f. europaeum TaxID=173218 RepID=A0AAE1I7C8_9HYPO|nr:hypothetical protein Triagg1_8945 [Trichoderma aggressivum f. europaeum]